MIPDLLNKNYLGCKGKWFQSYDNKYPLFQGLKRGKNRAGDRAQETGGDGAEETGMHRYKSLGTQA
jgi:hypothetical protein